VDIRLENSMASTTETLKVTEHSEIGPLLDDANAGPVLLEKDGVVYRLSRVDDEWPDIDPEHVEKVIDETLGSWSDIDAKALIAELYEARERGSRSMDRP
jgi:hypothetical protein